MLGALKAAGGLWFGWSGEISEEEKPLNKVTRGNITWASFALKEKDYDEYYSQFSNAVLWPAFHYRLDWSNSSVNPSKAIRASTRYWRINCCLL